MWQRAKQDLVQQLIAQPTVEATAILAWSDREQVGWHYIAPGKPVQNAFIENDLGHSGSTRA